jgi:hypothetical protein
MKMKYRNMSAYAHVQIPRVCQQNEQDACFDTADALVMAESPISKRMDHMQAGDIA